MARSCGLLSDEAHIDKNISLLDQARVSQFLYQLSRFYTCTFAHKKTLQMMEGSVLNRIKVIRTT